MTLPTGLDPRTPVLIGAGIAHQRLDDPADALEAAALMALALDRAGADAGVDGLVDRVDEIIVAEGIWGYGDPGRSVLGGRSPGARTVLAAVGVLQQTMFTRACTQIASGSADVVVVCGGEAKFRALRAAITGTDAPETAAPGAVPDVRLAPEGEMITDVEIVRGLAVPAHQYAVMESAIRHDHGETPEANRVALGDLMAALSEVAAGNPDAWTRTPMTPDEVMAAPMVSTPYTRACCSQWNVDQAAAFILCPAGLAESLGVRPERWVVPHLGIESNLMVPLPERVDLGRSPAIDVAGERLLSHGHDPAGIELLEIYSCFPAAVRMQCEGLGIDPSRRLSVTGGMNFGGGPLNNFTLQALARIVPMLRDAPDRSALVTSISGMVTKFGLGLWSGRLPTAGFAAIDVSDEARARTGTVPVDADYRGPATIAGYTVAHERGVPVLAVVIADAPTGARAVATGDDPDLIAALCDGDWCGRLVTVSGELLVDVPR